MRGFELKLIHQLLFCLNRGFSIAPPAKAITQSEMAPSSANRGVYRVMSSESTKTNKAYTAPTMGHSYIETTTSYIELNRSRYLINY